MSPAAGVRWQLQLLTGIAREIRWSFFTFNTKAVRPQVKLVWIVHTETDAFNKHDLLNGNITIKPLSARISHLYSEESILLTAPIKMKISKNKVEKKGGSDSEIEW